MKTYIDGMTGCSDGGCLFHYKAPGTMVTNGGCSCMRELQRTDEGWKAVRTILFLRRELMGLNDWAKEPTGYCIAGDNCVCGGDVPAVREGCFEWKRG